MVLSEWSRTLTIPAENPEEDKAKMPYATTDDGVRLYYEETGKGRPLILVHEFAGDIRSYEPQLRHFGKKYRVIAFNARGFPRPTFPRARHLIRRRARRMTFFRYSTTSAKRKLIFRGFPWAVSRRSISAFVITIGHCPCVLADVDMGRNWKRGRTFRAEPTRLPTSSDRRVCRPSPKNMPTGRPGCNSKTRIRVALPNSSRCCQSIQPPARRTPRRACRRSDRRSILWSRR